MQQAVKQFGDLLVNEYGTVESYLISPAGVKKWTDWDIKAEKVHGITREDLVGREANGDEGRAVRDNRGLGIGVGLRLLQFRRASSQESRDDETAQPPKASWSDAAWGSSDRSSPWAFSNWGKSVSESVAEHDTAAVSVKRSEGNCNS